MRIADLAFVSLRCSSVRVILIAGWIALPREKATPLLLTGFPGVEQTAAARSILRQLRAGFHCHSGVPSSAFNSAYVRKGRSTQQHKTWASTLAGGRGDGKYDGSKDRAGGRGSGDGE